MSISVATLITEDKFLIICSPDVLSMFFFSIFFHKVLHVTLDLCLLKTDAYFQAHIEECFNPIRSGLFIHLPGSGGGGSEARMTEIKITIIQLK